MDNTAEPGAVVESPEPIWKRRGFDSDEAMDRAFVAVKDDLKALKAKAKSLEERAAKADEYERVQNEKAQAEMSELDRAKALVEELTRKVASHEADIAKRDKALLYERMVSSKMSGVPEAEAKLLRRLYDAEALKGFDTAEELQERLDAVLADWQASKPVPQQGNEGFFKRPAAPGAVTPPPPADRTGQFDEAKFEELRRKTMKPPLGLKNK